ncbi:HAD domain-containing protein [Streptomyces sp. NBC_01180]|uniref:HAD domain-containing protein n=1 Tax=Streptomyces sp. NBC_01180 TaxID=2903763 RepID=UPI00386B483A|nr:HAD domain-containing protein [Streptomyces sp. NBC_01180]
MTGSPLRLRPLLFLDVDGALIPFGATPEQYPDGYPTYMRQEVGAHPLLARVNPTLGPRLMALPCELVWATTWETEANKYLAPLLGLPQLPVVTWPEPSRASREDERGGLHWKTRALVDWSDGRPFAWLDDEITDTDRAWTEAHHPARTLLRRVDPRQGLTDADFAALDEWLRAGDVSRP